LRKECLVTHPGFILSRNGKETCSHFFQEQKTTCNEDYKYRPIFLKSNSEILL
jgi:hypothetical protein